MNNGNIVATVDVSFENIVNMDAEFGVIYHVIENSRIYYASTATWNSQPELVSERGYVYIYSDYRKNDQDQDIPCAKVGDGSAYLIDLPFTDDIYAKHIINTHIHVTDGEREKWDNKVTCFLDPTNDENLIFSKT